MIRYFTSDLHFGHANIIKYCDRPFSSAEEMDLHFVQWWNNTVTEDDTVYFLGDFALSHEARIRDILEELWGNIYIVPGNHDKTLVKTLRRNPIKKVTLLEKVYEITIGGKKVVLCHFPMHEWNHWHNGSLHLHGHVHGNTPQTAERRFDVGWDANRDFVTEEQIIGWMNPLTE